MYKALKIRKYRKYFDSFLSTMKCYHGNLDRPPDPHAIMRFSRKLCDALIWIFCNSHIIKCISEFFCLMRNLNYRYTIIQFQLKVFSVLNAIHITRLLRIV